MDSRLNFLCVLILLLLVSCTEESFQQQERMMVVEGWIDSDDYPIVMVTTTVPVSGGQQQVETVDEYLLKWAKVTVDDGEKLVVLTGKVDTCFTPPYIFTTGQMKGVPGKTYKLTVNYGEFYAEAETTIPNPVSIDSFSVTPVEGDSLFQLKACFKDDETEKNYYKFFVNVKGKDNYYRPSYLGTVNDEVLQGHSEVTVYQPSRLFYDEYIPFFRKNDTLSVKFSQMDADAFQFWKTYDGLQTFSGVLFFPYISSLPSNIKGGVGYWFGYGSKKYYLDLNSYIQE